MTTPDQSLVTTVLAEMHLKEKAAIRPRPDGPQEYIVTEETLTFLKDKTVTIDIHGNMKVS